MIIQTAPAGQPRLAIMMYEHTALSHQFARGFGNDQFQAPEPNDLMFSVVLHHDAGWFEFDRDPATDQATGLPYNLVETPAEHITRELVEAGHLGLFMGRAALAQHWRPIAEQVRVHSDRRD